MMSLLVCLHLPKLASAWKQGALGAPCLGAGSVPTRGRRIRSH